VSRGDRYGFFSGCVRSPLTLRSLTSLRTCPPQPAGRRRRT
jgi:hypothetical protein